MGKHNPTVNIPSPLPTQQHEWVELLDALRRQYESLYADYAKLQSNKAIAKLVEALGGKDKTYTARASDFTRDVEGAAEVRFKLKGSDHGHWDETCDLIRQLESDETVFDQEYLRDNGHSNSVQLLLSKTNGEFQTYYRLWETDLFKKDGVTATEYVEHADDEAIDLLCDAIRQGAVTYVIE